MNAEHEGRLLFPARLYIGKTHCFFFLFFLLPDQRLHGEKFSMTQHNLEKPNKKNNILLRRCHKVHIASISRYFFASICTLASFQLEKQ